LVVDTLKFQNGKSCCNRLPQLARRSLRLISAAAAVVFLAVVPVIAASPSSPQPVDEASAREAMQQGDWQQAATDWQQLYERGDAEAPAQLCALYFDGRLGKFDPSRVTDWCRRAAGGHDAWGLYRLGLLYLVGLGVDQNIDQSQALCAAAALHDPHVPAGFCLAAASTAKAQAAREQLQPPAATLPRQPATTGDEAGTPGQRCARAFNATPFDAGTAAKWCGNAANDDDAEAQYRVGLMNLLGVGTPRDLDIAEADCVRAGSGAKPRPATAFCLAATAKLREQNANLAIGRQAGSIDVDPTTGQALPKTGRDPFALDRVLDLPHTTPTGLSYTCRQVAQWALYEAPGLAILGPRDALFGRRIVDYRPADFASLEHLAETCAKTTATVGDDGTLQQQFATFRQSVRGIEARRSQLEQQQLANRDDAAEVAAVDRTYQASHLSMSIYSSQELACIERVKQSWQTSALSRRDRAIEIASSNRETENARFVTYGVANVVATASAQRDVLSISTYRCSFDKRNDGIADFQLSPGFGSPN
jgi:hypothetical protein